MTRFLYTLTLVAISQLGCTADAADLKSGPQTGDKVPGPFEPFNVNGDDAGRKNCLYCKHGDSPVAAVFARTADDANLRKLLAALDAAAVKNEKAELGTFVVYLSDDGAKLEAALKKQCDDAKYKQIVLALDSAAGPERYRIAKDADITVILYRNRKVVSNFAFAKGKLAAEDVEKIAADVSKIVKE